MTTPLVNLDDECQQDAEEHDDKQRFEQRGFQSKLVHALPPAEGSAKNEWAS